MPQLTIGTQRLIQKAVVEAFEHEQDNNKHETPASVILSSIVREVTALAQGYADEIESDLEGEKDEC